jgi:hypothetical protein
MANPPYDPTPDVMPRGDAPIPFQRDNSGVIGSALDKLSTGLKTAGNVYDQTVTGDAFNQFETFSTKAMRGDPSQSTPGPDGIPIPNTGYMGTNGRAALDAEQPTWKSIEAEEKRISSGIKSPTALALFQRQVAKYKNDLRSQIGSHAASQADVWSNTVANTSAQLAIDRIAANPDDPAALKGAAVDLRNARIKQAQLAGAQPGDALWRAALSTADQEFITAQIAAVGTDDPARAMRIAEKNKAILGDGFDEVYERYRVRAAEANGTQAATRILGQKQIEAEEANQNSIANPAQPVYRQVTAAIPGGFSPGGLARLVQIESGGKPGAVSPSGKHVGLGQFSEATWKLYGKGDRSDPMASIEATQRYAAANGAALTRALGRPPTDAELYLAHQQGPGKANGSNGAIGLLKNPDALASSIVGKAAVVQNGGRADMTAAEYVAMWAHRFNKTKAANAIGMEAPQVEQRQTWAPMPAPGDSAAPAQVQGTVAPSEVTPVDPNEVPRLGADYEPRNAYAEAMEAILADTSLDKDAQDYALQHVRTLKAVDEIRQAEQVAAQKAAEAAARDEYTEAILTGKTSGLTDRIAADPRLDAETKMTLVGNLASNADRTVSGAVSTYGEGYFTVMQQILAEPGDPSRITDPLAILRMALPGGPLTIQGAQKLQTMMTSAQKSPDAAAANNAKAGLMNYAKGKLSFEQDFGTIKIPDPKGAAIFNARFIPLFEKSYADWVAKGNDPFEFLTQENIDKMIGGLRDPREMAVEELLARSSGINIEQLPDIPAPAGADPDSWKVLVYSPPTVGDQPLPQDKWTSVLTKLYTTPTPSAKKWFDHYFGASGFTADEVLTVLAPEGTEVREVPEGTAPPAAPELPAPPENRPGAKAVINGQIDLGLPMPAGTGTDALAPAVAPGM